MTLRLTEAKLAAAYTFMRACEPFDALKLPPAHKIKFKVVRDPTIHADFGVENGKPTIRVSENGVGHTVTLLGTMGHEMVHLWQHLAGKRDSHGASFKALSKSVCASHGFDPNTF